MEWGHDIVQETEIKTIPMEKKCKKAKWLSGETFHIAVKRREVKSKGGKERYKHLNAEFERIASRDKKAFFSDQWKEIEENNRVGKTRDLFKKFRDTKGKFHAKMGSIKERNGMDLAEAEDIKKKVILFAIILFKNFRIVYNKPIFLYFFTLIAEEGFFISPCYSLELCV